MTNAATISRQLRGLGFSPVAPSDRSRQGLRVTNGLGRVRVAADLNSEREAQRLAAEARVALTDAGRAIEFHDGTSFYVVERLADGSWPPAL